MENKIKCQRCGNDEVWKAGKPRVKQQYKCKECKKKFITDLNYSREFKQKAIKMLYEWNSGRAVDRIMGINKSTAYNLVKKAEEQIKSSNCEEERAAELPQPADEIEMDELFCLHQVEKNRAYVITLVTRKPRQIVGFDVAYDKKKRIQRLIDSSINVKHYYSDANPSYQKVSYSGQHFTFATNRTHSQSKLSILTFASTSLRFNANPNAFFARWRRSKL